jgi:hypothetical protein
MREHTVRVCWRFGWFGNLAYSLYLYWLGFMTDAGLIKGYQALHMGQQAAARMTYLEYKRKGKWVRR